ncbi:hypothetical protein OY671_012424, partial [Metschnikowia pulcherrima]
LRALRGPHRSHRFREGHLPHRRRNGSAHRRRRDRPHALRHAQDARRDDEHFLYCVALENRRQIQLRPASHAVVPRRRHRHVRLAQQAGRQARPLRCHPPRRPRGPPRHRRVVHDYSRRARADSRRAPARHRHARRRRPPHDRRHRRRPAR